MKKSFNLLLLRFDRGETKRIYSLFVLFFWIFHPKPFLSGFHTKTSCLFETTWSAENFAFLCIKRTNYLSELYFDKVIWTYREKES